MKPGYDYSKCHTAPTISSEQFIADHVFSYIICGDMILYNGDASQHFQSGDYCFFRRNSLGRYIKKQVNGRFDTITFYFDQEFLQNFKKENQIASAVNSTIETTIVIKKSDELDNFFKPIAADSIHLSKDEKKEFIFSRQTEFLRVLLLSNPTLEQVLFDFSPPYKIDIEAFMNKNYHFNVSIHHFAYLTGRSLSQFKRDFAAIYRTTPSRWLTKKRLQDAYHLIKEQHKSPSEIYLALGFENLSHFSFAFKKKYGVPPKAYLNFT